MEYGEAKQMQELDSLGSYNIEVEATGVGTNRDPRVPGTN